MERGPIISEYFQLRDDLNRANKLSNQETELTFEIEETRLFEYKLVAVSRGKNESHKIALVERTAGKTWERAGATRFRKLEEFCAACLNEVEDSKAKPKRPRKIPDEFKELMSRKVLNCLKMLLLNKGYEP